MPAQQSVSPDGIPFKQELPVSAERLHQEQAAQERLQSGGLDDDPTDSGEPVKNRRSFTNLTGGR